jgi:hypothetical protein
VSTVASTAVLRCPVVIKTDFYLVSEYRGADKSLARPGRKQATATEGFDVNISYLLS